MKGGGGLLVWGMGVWHLWSAFCNYYFLIYKYPLTDFWISTFNLWISRNEAKYGTKLNICNLTYGYP